MLSAVERKIEQYIDDLNDSDAKALYLKIPAGKRLRARLILTIAKDTPMAVKTSAVVEMIHAASLLHDDVIDDAFLRRGKPSINATLGDKTAIMFGDVLYSKAFFELVDIDRRVARAISWAVTQLSLGERRDVILSKSFNTDKEAYMHMLYQKTASLIEASAESAAILAGKRVEPYKIYGKNLGIAFQMIDDLLDITQDAKTLGKPAMHDFKEGKTTLPYIDLYEALDSKGKEKLVSMHGRDISKDEQDWIKENMEKFGILDKNFLKAKSLIEEAVSLMRDEGESGLEAIALKMIERNY